MAVFGMPRLAVFTFPLRRGRARVGVQRLRGGEDNIENCMTLLVYQPALTRRVHVMKTRFTPLVSVLLPVYNNVQYLGEAIESILTQTMGDLECLLSMMAPRNLCGRFLTPLLIRVSFACAQDQSGSAGSAQQWP